MLHKPKPKPKKTTKKITKKSTVRKIKKIPHSKKDLQFFKTVPLLAELSEADVLHVYSIAQKRLFKKGSVIMKENDPGECMYLFYEGKAEVLNSLTMKYGKGDFGETEKSMSKLNSSFVSFIGEMALLEHAPRSATITASTDCILYEISKDDFRDLGNNYPQIGYKILLKMAEVLASRLRKTNKDVLKLTTALSIALSR